MAQIGAGREDRLENKKSPQLSLIASIPEYHGKEGDRSEIDLFELAVNEAKELGQFSDQQAISVAKLRLRGLAAEFMRASAEDIEKINDFDLHKFINLLRERFCPRELLAYSLEHLLTSVKQKPLESVQSYSDRVRSILSNMQVDKLTSGASELLLNTTKIAFLKGLRDELRGPVVRTSPESFDQAHTLNGKKSYEPRTEMFRRGEKPKSA